MNAAKRRDRARAKARALRNGTYRPTQWGANGPPGKAVREHRDRIHAITRSNEGLAITILNDPNSTLR